MLVLSRKLGEKIYIGPDICVTIVDVDRGKVRVGIDAPREVMVLRSELDKPPENPNRLYRPNNPTKERTP